MSRLINPWPAGRTINPNGKYGWRTHPITKKRAFHTGVDVAGTYPVAAAADGTVVHVGWNPKGGGNTVVIDHGDIHTAYFHGRERTPFKVGSRIRRGDFIYTSGATGIATGPHLHFEVRRTRDQSTHMDPTPYLPGANVPTPTPTPVPGQQFVELKEDGVLGPATWRAMQRILHEKGFYKGPVDGSPSRQTIIALQQAINANAFK
jgi:peptidoglycan hydrolase-like protein with peptidoglycan-binding domain